MQEEIHKRLHAPVLGPCACSQVRRLGRKLSSLYDTLLSPEDLTITQYSLLAIPNDEIGDLLTEIVKLQRKVSGLTIVAQHLFVLASSNQRFTEEQETAFKEIPKLLKQIQENEL